MGGRAMSKLPVKRLMLLMSKTAGFTPITNRRQFTGVPSLTGMAPVGVPARLLGRSVSMNGRMG